MNALASFIAYMPVAFVQKILTSLNSTLPQRGQAVSVHILTGTYRSQSAFSGTYVDPPGADPLGGAPDIRHRKPREIVPQVSADASIKTR
ncbi:hypothetical protein ALC56_05949 [Trachymyrmex septentrionalis]|uniref:Uncharacterized protein n=1 Tax=Trachymyrmex septentrionalis TaxID=34720 RepID=A0A195FGE7_9HYME|nr:hypothetical protein ALC56_05949 [Trachymyrmex septentrionalis]